MKKAANKIRQAHSALGPEPGAFVYVEARGDPWIASAPSHGGADHHHAGGKLTMCALHFPLDGDGGSL